MKQEREKKETKNKGFTLMEVLVSLLLVTLAVLSIARIIVFALDAHRRSVVGFTMVQEIENYKNSFLAKPYESSDLADGSYSKKNGKFELTWNIESLSATLKRINLSISYKVYNKKIYFYKSKFITHQGEEK